MPLFTSMLNYRHSVAEVQSPEAALRTAQAWSGIDLLDSQERTNYPLNMFIDDLVEDMRLVAQVDASIDPERVCRRCVPPWSRWPMPWSVFRRRPYAVWMCSLPKSDGKLLVDFNDSAAAYPQDVCLHTLFEAQAERTPDAIALVHEGGTLTYAELNRQANRLAHRLRKMGVVPDARVAVCVNRSPELVVGLLAILKAGGGYVPLDPTYPIERLAYMLEDSAAAVVLVRAGVAAPDTGTIPTLDLQGGAADGPAKPRPIRASTDLLLAIPPM